MTHSRILEKFSKISKFGGIEEISIVKKDKERILY